MWYHLVGVAPERTTKVSTIALPLVPSAAAAIAAHVTLINAASCTSSLVHIGVGVIMVVVDIPCWEAMRGRAFRVRLVVCVSVMVSHEGLVPDRMAAVFHIIPHAGTCIRDTKGLAPGKAKRCLEYVGKLQLQSHRPGLRDTKAIGNSLAAVVAVETAADLVPTLVPVSPLMGVIPLLFFSPTGLYDITLSHVGDECCRAVFIFLVRLLSAANHVVLLADGFELLPSVKVSLELLCAIRVSDLCVDVVEWWFDG